MCWCTHYNTMLTSIFYTDIVKQQLRAFTQLAVHCSEALPVNPTDLQQTFISALWFSSTKVYIGYTIAFDSYTFGLVVYILTRVYSNISS